MSIEPSKQYAAWYEPLVMSILIAVTLVIVGLLLRSEIRDAQRRVAVLEQVCK